jgi:hypothetical protein
MRGIVGTAGRYIGQEGGILVVMKDAQGHLVDAGDEDVGPVLAKLTRLGPWLKLEKCEETNDIYLFQVVYEENARCRAGVYRRTTPITCVRVRVGMGEGMLRLNSLSRVQRAVYYRISIAEIEGDS